ncbi:serine protease [Dactylosporangium sp. NPDC048998]|uniref:S1 family peptidase n=1 Tax=Dactylosporangium sp. NPDC048998 TaxID=3363976 RepID=UPI00371E13B6
MFISLALRRRRGTFAATVALLGTLPAVTVCVPAAAAPSPTYTRNEPAIAVAGPSVVYLEATYTGVLRDTKTGQPRAKEPVVVVRRCSGVVVDTQGDVLTTTLCVQPSDEILLVNALYRLGRDLVTQGQLAADKVDEYVTSMQATSSFTGEKATAKPQVAVWGQFDIATPELNTDPAIPGTIQSALPADGGNAAVVRLQGEHLPVVELAPDADPRPGDTVIGIGYGTASSESAAGSYTVRAKTVTVTGRTATNRIGINGDVGPDARGGAVVDTRGRLVALLDTDPNSPGEPTHDLITQLHLSRLLEQAKVTNDLSDVDRAYRDALAAYFDGRFSVAVGKFDAVLKMDPKHIAAHTYRDRAAQRLDTEGDSVANQATWLQYLLAVVIGAALVVLISLVAQRVGRLLAARRAPEPSAGTQRPVPVPLAEPESQPTVLMPAVPMPPVPVPPAPVPPVQPVQVDADATVVLARSDLGAGPPGRADPDATVVMPAVPANDETVVLPWRTLHDGPADRRQAARP